MVSAILLNNRNGIHEDVLVKKVEQLNEKLAIKQY